MTTRRPPGARLLPRPTLAERGVVALVALLCAFIIVGASGASGWLRVTADDMAAQVFGEALHPARQLQVFYSEVSDSTVPPDAGAAVEDSLAPALDAVLKPPRHTVVTMEAVPRPMPARPATDPGFLTVAGFPHAEGLADIVEGSFPRRGSHKELLPADVAAAFDGPRRVWIVEVALEQSASKKMNLPVGTYLDLVTRGYRNMPGDIVVLRVSGTYKAAASYPSALDDVDNAREPAVSTMPEATLVRTAALAADDLTVLEATWPSDPEVRWTFDPDGAPTAEEADAVVGEARRLSVQPWPKVLDNKGIVSGTGIGDLGSTFVDERDASNSLSALMLSALGSAALVLLLAAASVLEARRREVTEVLRARGADTRHLAVTRAGEALLMTLPGLAAAAMTTWVTPLEPRDLVPGLVAALVCVVLLTAAQVSPWRELSDRVRAAVGDALQLVAVALAVGVVALMLWRDRLDAADPLLIALPALLGVAATVLVVRGARWLTATVRRLVGRTRRVTPLVGSSQAGTTAQHVMLPVAGVVLATCCALLTVAVDDTVRRGADRAAWQAVGADVLVSGGGFDAEARQRVEDVPGVTAVAAVHTVTGILDTRVGLDQVKVVAVDPAALQQVTGAGPEPVEVPGSAEGRLGILASEDLDLDGDETILDYAQASMPVQVKGRIQDIPGVTDGGSFVLVDAEDLRKASDRLLARSETLLVAGNPDLDRLREVVHDAAPTATVRAREQVAAHSLGDAVVDRTLSVARASTVAAALLALFAAGLAVALGRPLRRRTMSVLHALGADARQARWVNAMELLPSMVGAALAAVGCVVLLLSVSGRGIDLAALTGAAEGPALRPDPTSWVTAAALLPLAVVLVAAASTRHGREGLDKRTPQEGEGR